MSYSAARHQEAIGAFYVVHLSSFSEIGAELFQNSPSLTDRDLDDGQDTSSHLRRRCKEKLLCLDDDAESLTHR